MTAAGELRTPDTVPPDVSGLDPEAQHAAVLAEWQLADDLYAGVFGDAYQGSRAQQQLAGRRRILDRHRPEVDRASGPWCLHPVTALRWPCPDYLDAAAGLVAGLDRTR